MSPSLQNHTRGPLHSIADSPLKILGNFPDFLLLPETDKDFSTYE